MNHGRPLTYHPQRGVTRLGTVLAVIGGLTLLAALLFAPARAWANLLLVSYYLLGIGLGGLLLVAFQYTSGAGWGVAIRRLPEALAALIPVASVGVLVVLLVYPSLYPWARAASEGADHGAAFRQFWLNRPFVVLRAIIYIAAWTLLARAIVRTSTQQDEDGNTSHTYTNRTLSAVFLVVYGVTCWLSSVDWIMSLEPAWASTIFGVYHFTSMFQGGVAAVAAMAILLCRQGVLRDVLSQDHLRDLGILLFSFSSFWMYIWFSQYMLIWYVNNPEETSHYVRRLHNGWQYLFYLNVLVNWVAPFLILMPRAPKRNPSVLLAMAVLILAGRWLDMYLMVVPPLGGGPFQALGIVEAGLAAGGVGVFLLVVPRALGKASLVPINDPFLVESLPHAEEHGSGPPCGDGSPDGIFRGAAIAGHEAHAG